MAFREVRIREVRNKLVFRFDPERDVIELYINGQPHYIELDNYRPPHRRRDMIGVDFVRIEGEGQGHEQ